MFNRKKYPEVALVIVTNHRSPGATSDDAPRLPHHRGGNDGVDGVDGVSPVSRDSAWQGVSFRCFILNFGHMFAGIYMDGLRQICEVPSTDMT